MSLKWMPREHEIKNHESLRIRALGNGSPCVVYEKKTLEGSEGKCDSRTL